MSSESMTSEYMMSDDQTKVDDDIAAQLEYAQDENETDDEVDDAPVIEDFEEELLQQGPGGLVTEIEEQDTNGNDNAAELEQEAGDLADELKAELEMGQAPSNQGTSSTTVSILHGHIPGVQKSGTLDFCYFDIRKCSIFWFHPIKHCLLKRMILRSFDLVQ